MPITADPFLCEVHVYHDGHRVDLVTVKGPDGTEVEIPLVVEVNRKVTHAELPTVDVKIYARLIEHQTGGGGSC